MLAAREDHRWRPHLDLGDRRRSVRPITGRRLATAICRRSERVDLWTTPLRDSRRGPHLDTNRASGPRLEDRVRGSSRSGRWPSLRRARRGADQDTYGPIVLFSTEVSTDSWAAVENVATGSAGYPGEISVAQGAIWAMLHPGVVSQDHGVEVHSLLYHSTDGGTWHSSLLPCPPSTVASVAAATSSRVFVVCSGGVAAGSQAKTAYLSTDGGASYKRVGDPPFAGDFDEVAASPLALSVAVASGATYIYTSFNEGHDWATTYLPQTGGLPLSDLSFTTPTQGVVIFGVPAYPQSLQLLMTRDSGHSWATIDISPS